MKAAVMYGPNDIRYEEMDRPNCPQGGFILKVEAIGLCGSDIRNMTTDSKQGKYPHVYGHEMVGIIDEVTPETPDKWKEGMRVFVHPASHCMVCETCRSGHTENCTNREYNTDRQGGFAQYAPVTKMQAERDSVYVIPDDVSFDLATLGEPLSSVYACQQNINVIIGAGPIGCFHAKMAKVRGAKKVIMVEINETRLERSRQYGVDVCIHSAEEDAKERILEETGGLGADIVISANPSNRAQAESIFYAKRGGIIVFFGGVKKGTLTALDTNYLHYHNLWVYGHFGASSMQIQESYELAISKDFHGEELITHVLPLSQINQAIDLARSGQAVKIVLHPWEEKTE